MIQNGPTAPKDPTRKGKGFYILKNQNIEAILRPDGCRSQEIYMDNDRMVSAAKITGNIEDEKMLELLRTIEGYKKLVTSIGITISADDPQASFECRMIAYGHTDIYKSGTHASIMVLANEVEHVLSFDEVDWSADDRVLGQFAIVFPDNLQVAQVSIKLYVKDDYNVPEEIDEMDVDTSSDKYKNMIADSLIRVGNTERFLHAVQKAKRGEDITVAYIGGSITQGAGAVPATTECYAYRSFVGFCRSIGEEPGKNIHYIRAGIGGTSSELGVARYEKDVLEFGKNEPDIVFIEFAVNDNDDETKGECYEGLLRKVYYASNHPAVILLFSVFSYDWNLQERFIPMGEAYDLPMVSIMNAVTDQFRLTEEQGRVITKRQFFYDIFHPSNIGHQIMGDCLCYYFSKALEEFDQDAVASEDGVLNSDMLQHSVDAVMSDDFEKVHYFDRKYILEAAKIDAGGFADQDKDLQMVERDMEHVPVAMFPDNWMHIADDQKPFAMDINCRILMLLVKDSQDKSFGKAKIEVDGEIVKIYDPNEVGWTHCNAALILREKESRLHHIEISMLEEHGKLFTILGFGYIK